MFLVQIRLYQSHYYRTGFPYVFISLDFRRRTSLYNEIQQHAYLAVADNEYLDFKSMTFSWYKLLEGPTTLPKNETFVCA